MVNAVRKYYNLLLDEIIDKLKIRTSNIKASQTLSDLLNYVGNQISQYSVSNYNIKRIDFTNGGRYWQDYKGGLAFYGYYVDLEYILRDNKFKKMITDGKIVAEIIERTNYLNQDIIIYTQPGEVTQGFIKILKNHYVVDIKDIKGKTKPLVKPNIIKGPRKIYTLPVLENSIQNPITKEIIESSIYGITNKKKFYIIGRDEIKNIPANYEWINSQFIYVLPKIDNKDIYPVFVVKKYQDGLLITITPKKDINNSNIIQKIDPNSYECKNYKCIFKDSLKYIEKSRPWDKIGLFS